MNNIRNLTSYWAGRRGGAYFYRPSWSKPVNERRDKIRKTTRRKTEGKPGKVVGRGGWGWGCAGWEQRCPAMGFTKIKQNACLQYSYFETIKFYWFVCAVDHSQSRHTQNRPASSTKYLVIKTCIGKKIEFIISKVLINTSTDKTKFLQSSLRDFVWI